MIRAICSSFIGGDLMTVLKVLLYLIGMPALMFILDLFLNALEKSVDVANSRNSNDLRRR